MVVDERASYRAFFLSGEFCVCAIETPVDVVSELLLCWLSILSNQSAMRRLTNLMKGKDTQNSLSVSANSDNEAADDL
jgi:hypothetical protein